MITTIVNDFCMMNMLFRLILFAFIIQIHHIVDINATGFMNNEPETVDVTSQPDSTDAIHDDNVTPSLSELSSSLISSAADTLENHTNTAETNSSTIHPNVTYVILPTEFYLGQTNLITVRSREPMTKLRISMNVTELPTTIEDHNQVYHLQQLNTTESWYGLDIPYEIPFLFTHTDSLWVKLIFNFTHCFTNGNESCTEFKTTEVINSIELNQPPIIILGETDKPIYRPGENVRFRFLTLNLNSLSPKSSNLPLPEKKLLIQKGHKGHLVEMNHFEQIKWHNIIYDQIIITDPMDNTVKQWFNLSPQQVINLNYPLLNNAKEGKWRLRAIVRNHFKENIEFTVKKYSLPKFIVSLTAPSAVNFESQYVQYSVCAKYTNGPPLKGNAQTILCVCNDYIWENQFHQLDDEQTVDSILTTPQCPFDGYETKTRPCIITSQPLEMDGCAQFNVSTEKFAFSTNKYFKWNQISILCTQVEEDATGSKLYNCLKGDQIEMKQTNLKLDLPSVYKSKLPINGKVKLANFDKTKNYSVKISVSDQKWGCYWRDTGEVGVEHYLNIISINSTGEAIVHIPPITSQHPVSIQAELLQLSSSSSINSSLSNDVNSINADSPNFFYWPYTPLIQDKKIIDNVVLRSWDSVSQLYLQLWPPKDKIVTTCPNLIKLTLLSNTRLSNKAIFIESVVRGKHLKIVLPAIDKISSSDGLVNDDNCIDRDDELGHYKCVSWNSTEIECLPGWSGENCLVPVCALECSKKGGFCSKPNQCQCKNGWTGATCDQCVKRDNCLHGKCLLGDDCVCDPGWAGYLCDSKKVIYEKFEDIIDPNSTKSVDQETTGQDLDKRHATTPTPSNYTKPIRTLYQRNIEFEIDGSWGPKFTAVLYIHDQHEETTPEIVSTQIIVEQIGNCSSDAIALESKSKSTNLKFSQSIADPGEAIQMTITPQGVEKPKYNCHTNSAKPVHSDQNSRGQLLNELCFVRISDTSLDNFQGDKNLVNLKYFTDKLIDYSMLNGFRPLVASSTQEAFLAAGFQLGSTYPEPIFANRIYPCPYLAFSNAVVMDSDGGVPPRAPLPVAPRYKSFRNTMKPRLRDFFPEVWLFDVIPLSDDTPAQINNADNCNENEIKNIESDGMNKLRSIALNLTVPDTITTWRASAYCTTKQNGLWIGQPQMLTVTMPFYAEITLPKEMKRGEIVHIPVSVFILDRKYLHQSNDNSDVTNECYEISVQIEVDHNEWLITTSNVFGGCLCSGEKRTYLVGLLPQKLGQLNVTVESYAIRNNEFCRQIMPTDNDNQHTLVFKSLKTKDKTMQPKLLSDKLRRQINVIPEGIQRETTLSDIICLNEQQIKSTRQFEFTVPEHIVKDSLHSYISYSDEVLGPALVNLDSLVRLPTGCGEQNMILVAPNVYILDYLTSTPNNNREGDLNDKKEKYIQSARSNILAGYRQQMKYRREDGSFSAFGKYDKQGSTWLTAFVIRVFAKAYQLQPDSSIDWSSLFHGGIDFLLKHQNHENHGCFEESGKVLYSPLQGINHADASEWKSILLTSYVNLALYQTQMKFLKKSDEVLVGSGDDDNLPANNYTIQLDKSFDAAFKCLNNKLLSLDSFEKIPTPVLVQLSYTYTIMKPHGKWTVKLQNETINRKQVSTDQFGTKIFWSGNDYATHNNNNNSTTGNSDSIITEDWRSREPRDLESTAYTFLMLNQINQSVSDLFPIIRWISAQQKSNGGFYSTQDTILGLEAIAVFAKRLGLSKTVNSNSTSSSSNVLFISNTMNLNNFKLNDEITPEKRQVINQIELEPSHLNQNEKLISSTWELNSNQTQTDCILVQNTFIYNLPEKKDMNKKIKLSFDVIQQNKLSNVNCKSATLSMCLQLNNMKNVTTINTGMLLVRVSMVTGWEPAIDELNSQLGSEDDSLKKVTINDQNEVSLYFDEFSENEVNKFNGDWTKLKRCVNVPLKQTHYVQNAKTATITALEYYTPDESVTVSYQLDECKQEWIIPSTNESSTQEVTETITTTESILSNVTTASPMKTLCPICIDQVNDIKQLTDEVFTSVCNYSDGIFLIKVIGLDNGILNVTLIQISPSHYVTSWNTTILIPNFTQCPCPLLQTHNNLVLFFNKSTLFYPGDPQLNLNTVDTKVTIVSSEEVLPSLKLAHKKWTNMSSADSDDNFYHFDLFSYNCKRLSMFIKYIEAKFLI
ncbi:unnamed protein product [Schistosoma turkestanicum]|nr:unnamed protein product [Schistosoma turkestanicum]